MRATKKNITEKRFRVTGLVEDSEVEFRVIAENAAGPGEPSEPSPYIRVVDPVYPPGPPLSPAVVSTTKNSVDLTWKKPNYDGGQDISGYLVEYAKLQAVEDDEISWVKCNVPLGFKDHEFTVKGLSENAEYKIR